MLLDTHVWLWFMAGSDDLPASLSERIAAAPQDAYLSPISVWEALMLAHKKRISVAGDPVRFFRAALSEYPFKPLPLTHEIAIKSRELEFVHEDPADRFLAASAIVYGIPIATVDQRLLGLPWLPHVS